MAEPDALFVPVDGGFMPTELSRGPWSPDALHGGPVAALVARSVEQADAPGAMTWARLTIDLVRAVPFAPLEVSVEVTRPGRKVQQVAATVRVAGEGPAAGTLVTKALGLRLRRDPTVNPSPAGAVAPPPLEPPEAGRAPDFWGDTDVRAYHNTGVEHRVVAGSVAEPGPITDWIRLAVPVVAGEPPTPLQRVAAAADFGNGVSCVLDYERFTFINPDLTITMDREPDGEWIALEAVTELGRDGVGLAESILHDRAGPFGRAVQTLLIEARPQPAS